MEETNNIRSWKIYKFLKKVYHTTSYFKNKQIEIKELQEKTVRIKIAKDSEIMQNIFNNKYEIYGGPFKGMKYINRSSCSTLLPKIMGCYEEPIQDWIYEVIENNNYFNILDIGSAEGYYAVGFAIKIPNIQITAYDIDAQARTNINELIKLNNIINIEVKEECTHVELNSKCKSKTLVFCDIEGFEDVLLDPKKAPNLEYVDLIIESHDFIVPFMTEKLISRFYKTHTIKIIVDYPYRLKKYKTPNEITIDVYGNIINEMRPNKMKWILMQSVYGKI